MSPDPRDGFAPHVAVQHKESDAGPTEPFTVCTKVGGGAKFKCVFKLVLIFLFTANIYFT